MFMSLFMAQCLLTIQRRFLKQRLISVGLRDTIQGLITAWRHCRQEV